MNRTSATWVRWRIVALLVALSLLSWFLRVSMSIAYDEQIKDQYSDLPAVSASTVGMLGSPLGQGPLLTAAALFPGRVQYAIPPELMGFVYSAYILVYMLCMTPGGWFIDRFGARAALIIMGFGLTLFGALTGLVGWGTQLLAGVPGWLGSSATTAGLALALFLVIRSLMGAFAAPMYPAATHAVARWLPFRRQGLAQGLVQGAACLGIAATPLVFGGLIDGLGWPQAFLVLAVCTSLVSLVWAAYATDRPEQHPSANPAEQRLISAGAPDPAAPDDFAPVHVAGEWEPAEGEVRSPAPTVPTAPGGGWALLLRNRSLMFLTVGYAAVGYFEYLFFFWMDFYFKQTLHLSDGVRRVYAGIPILAMAAGMGLGGWVSDGAVRLYGYRIGRALVPVIGMLGGAVFLGAGVLAGTVAAEPRWIVFWFSLALAAVGAVEAPTWMTALELGGRRGGTAAGICNTGGNIGGLLSPSVTPWVARYTHWTVAIGLAALVCLLGAALWRWIDPRERVDERGKGTIQR